jgi:hypothetical protein
MCWGFLTTFFFSLYPKPRLVRIPAKNLAPHRLGQLDPKKAYSAVTVTYVEDPSCFWMRFDDGSYESVQTALNADACVERMRRIPVASLKPGLAVCVRAMEAGVKQWLRGEICCVRCKLERESEKSVLVR